MCILYQTYLCVPKCLKSLTPGEQNKRYWKGNLLTVISYFLCCWLDLCLNKNISFVAAPWFCSEGSILCLILASCHGNNYDVMNSVQWLHCSVFYLYSQFSSDLASKPESIYVWYWLVYYMIMMTNMIQISQSKPNYCLLLISVLKSGKLRPCIFIYLDLFQLY